MTVMRKKSQETILGFCVAPKVVTPVPVEKSHPLHPDLLVSVPVNTPLKPPTQNKT